MKKVIYFALSALFLVSCGKAKEEKQETETAAKQPEEYSVVIEAVYEKDDSISVVFQQNGFFQYEKAISKKIIGGPGLQRIEMLLPKGETLQNVGYMVSSNKQQEGISIKNISILKNGNVVLDGSAGKFPQYFSFDQSFKWDEKTQRYLLTHTNKYPPGLVGNDKFLQMFN